MDFTIPRQGKGKEKKIFVQNQVETEGLHLTLKEKLNTRIRFPNIRRKLLES